MSDVFEEINEDIRRDNLTKLWKKYGIWVIGICVAIIAAVGGSRGYESYQLSQAVNASNAYISFVEALNSKQNSVEQLEKLKQTNHKGYIFLAQMSQADNYIQQENIIEAVKLYDTISVDNSLVQNDRNLASIRAALLLVDSASYDDMKKRLAEINVVENSFRFQARELLGLSAYKAQKYVEANTLFLSLAQNSQTPNDIRNRANQLVILLVSKI